MATFETVPHDDYIAGDDYDSTRKFITAIDRETALNCTVDEYLNFENTIPWEPLPHESMKAWQAFKIYLDAGRKRSAAYVRGNGLKVSNWWLQDFKWVLRSRLYDEYVMAEEAVEQHRLTREIRKRHADQASQALDGLMAPFKEYQRRVEENPGQLAEEMSAMDGKKLMSTMQASARVLQPLMSAERLTQDLPTEMTETNVHGQLTIQDSPEALINVLSVLEETGVGAALFGTGPIIDLVDTSDEQVDPSNPPSEAASLPAGTP